MAEELAGDITPIPSKNQTITRRSFFLALALLLAVLALASTIVRAGGSVLRIDFDAKGLSSLNYNGVEFLAYGDFRR